MNARHALTIIILLGICSCQTDDRAGRALDAARRLAEQGDYEAALAKHVWFHDNALKENSAYYGVRLSFALSDWIELGKKYPEAIDKLKSIRDQKTSQLLKGDLRADLFHDVQSINEHLNENASTVELFKKLGDVDPVFASQIYDVADEALVQTHAYELARKYLGNPTKRLATARRNFEEGMKYAKTSKLGDDSQRAFENIFTSNVIRIIIILRETGDIAAARNIQSEALKTLDNERIRDALKE